MDSKMDFNYSFLEGNATDGNETEVEADYIFDRHSIRVFFIVIYSIVFFICVVGNLVVLLVVSFHWRMRHITKFCLANLALADLCVGLFCVYQNLFTYLISSWFLGEFLCKMYQFINGLSHTASVLTLVVVCVERYLAILHPFKCKQILTKNRLRVIMAFAWLASGLYASPRLYYMVTLHVPRHADGIYDTEIICTARRTLYDSRAFDMTNSIVLFLCPLILMTVLYSRVGTMLWRTGESQFRWTAVPAINIISSSDENLHQDSESGFIVTHTDTSTEQPSHALNSTSRSKRLVSTAPAKPELYCHSERKQYLKVSGASRKQRESQRSNNNVKNPRKSAHPVSNRGAFFYPPKYSEGNGTQGWKRISGEKTGCTKGSEVKIENHFHGGKAELKSRQSIVKMLIVIVVVFALCHLPFHCRKFALYWWPNFDLGSNFNILALPLTNLCMYANCAINPIIYSFMSSSFRASLRDLLSCRFRKPFRHSSTVCVSTVRRKSDRLARRSLSGPYQV